MRIHSRELLTPLQEGLGYDTRLALTGMSDVRDSMQDLLTPHGEDVARGLTAANGQAGSNSQGNNIVDFVLATSPQGLRHPTAADLVVKGKAIAYGQRGGVLTFSDGGKGLLTMQVKNLGGQNYPILNQPYEIVLPQPQTLISPAPAGPFTWFIWTKFKRKHGPLPATP